jgi:hypothetical protein
MSSSRRWIRAVALGCAATSATRRGPCTWSRRGAAAGRRGGPTPTGRPRCTRCRPPARPRTPAWRPRVTIDDLDPDCVPHQAGSECRRGMRPSTSRPNAVLGPRSAQRGFCADHATTAAATSSAFGVPRNVVTASAPACTQRVGVRALKGQRMDVPPDGGGQARAAVAEKLRPHLRAVRLDEDGDHPAADRRHRTTAPSRLVGRGPGGIGRRGGQARPAGPAGRRPRRLAPRACR